MQGIETKLAASEKDRFDVFQKWESTRSELEAIQLKLASADALAAAKTREADLLNRKISEITCAEIPSGPLTHLDDKRKAQADANAEALTEQIASLQVAEHTYHQL